MHNSRERHEMKEGTNIRSFNFDKDPTEVMVLEKKKYKKKNDTIDIKCVVCFNQQMHASACIHMVKKQWKHYCFLVFDHANTFASMRWLVKIHNKNVIFSRKAELLDNRKKKKKEEHKEKSFSPFHWCASKQKRFYFRPSLDSESPFCVLVPSQTRTRTEANHLKQQSNFRTSEYRIHLNTK